MEESNASDGFLDRRVLVVPGPRRSQADRPALDRGRRPRSARAGEHAGLGQGADAPGTRAARFCSNCGQPTRGRGGGLAARVPDLRDAAFSAHRSGRHHAGGRRRRLPARPPAAVSEGHVFGARRLRRAGRDDRGRRCGARSWRRPASPAATVRYFASQPWPFPSSLMIGCFAEARSRAVTVDRTELEDARWFSRDEALRAARKAPSRRAHRADPDGDRPSPAEAWAVDGIGFSPARAFEAGRLPGSASPGIDPRVPHGLVALSTSLGDCFWTLRERILRHPPLPSAPASLCCAARFSQQD